MPDVYTVKGRMHNYRLGVSVLNDEPEVTVQFGQKSMLHGPESNEYLYSLQISPYLLLGVIHVVFWYVGNKALDTTN